MEIPAMYDTPKSLREIIELSPQLAKLRNNLHKGEVIARFFEILPELKHFAEPMKLEKKTLHIAVENSALRNELKFKEKEIIKKINIFFKKENLNPIESENRVEKIKFLI